MKNILTAILGLGVTFSAFFLVKNIFDSIFLSTNESLHKKRLKQLQFNEKRISSEEEKSKQLIAKVTGPVTRNIIPRLKLNSEKMTQLEKDLEMAQWAGTFTPLTFIAMDITLKIIGAVLFILMFSKSKPFAVVLLLLVGFGFKFLFNNSIKNRKFSILCEFPDLINSIKGFLMSNMPLPQAMESSLPYVGEMWRPIIREFVINSEVYSQSECIEMLSDKIDIFEVRELWSLINLNAEQGIDIKECFNNQSDKIKSLHLSAMMDKIQKRQMLSIVIQGPLLLDMLFIFGLPTFVALMTTL